MRVVKSTGLILALLCMTWAVTWLGFGIYVVIADKLYVQSYFYEHLFLVLHTPIIVAICLALETYKTLKTLRPPFCSDYCITGHVASWVMTWFIALASNSLSLTHICLFSPFSSAASIGIFVLAIWATADDILAILWSLGLYYWTKKLVQEIILAAAASKKEGTISLISNENIGRCRRYIK